MPSFRLVSAAMLLSAVFSTPAIADTHTAADHQQPAAAAADWAELKAAVASPLRDNDRARDRFRRPDETLAFFDVRPDMKVGEYAPGGGWYSRLLGIYLGPRGRLVGLFFSPASGPFSETQQTGIRNGATKFPADVAGWSGQPAERFAGYALDAIPDGENGTFDRILIMRMMHNINRWNIADSEIKAMRDLLKPDGMVGIEQHRARPDAPYNYTSGDKGYMREADVIAIMEVNGFTFVGRSEANANPADPANHPQGVWTLPPALRGVANDEDRARLTAIGESDRMTLLFRKRP